MQVSLLNRFLTRARGCGVSMGVSNVHEPKFPEPGFSSCTPGTWDRGKLTLTPTLLWVQNVGILHFNAGKPRRRNHTMTSTSSLPPSHSNPFPLPQNPTPYQIFHFPSTATASDIKARCKAVFLDSCT